MCSHTRESYCRLCHCQLHRRKYRAGAQPVLYPQSSTHKASTCLRACADSYARARALIWCRFAAKVVGSRKLANPLARPQASVIAQRRGKAGAASVLPCRSSEIAQIGCWQRLFDLDAIRFLVATPLLTAVGIPFAPDVLVQCRKSIYDVLLQHSRQSFRDGKLVGERQLEQNSWKRRLAPVL